MPAPIGSQTAERFRLSVASVRTPSRTPVIPRSSLTRAVVIAIACAAALVPTAIAAAPSWTDAGSLSESRYDAVAARLGDGTVVVAGGADSDGLASADRFDPATNSWSPIAAMHDRRGTAAGVALQDGRMLVTGGGSSLLTLSSAEIYDGAAGTWTLTSPMTTGRRLHNAITLADGRVLVVGGEGQRRSLDVTLLVRRS